MLANFSITAHFPGSNKARPLALKRQVRIPVSGTFVTCTVPASPGLVRLQLPVEVLALSPGVPVHPPRLLWKQFINKSIGVVVLNLTAAFLPCRILLPTSQVASFLSLVVSVLIPFGIPENRPVFAVSPIGVSLPRTPIPVVDKGPTLVVSLAIPFVVSLPSNRKPVPKPVSLPLQRISTLP